MGFTLACSFGFFMLCGFLFIEAIPAFMRSADATLEVLWPWKIWFWFSVIPAILVTIGREIIYAALFLWKPTSVLAGFLGFIRSTAILFYGCVFIKTLYGLFEVLNRLSFSQWGWQGCALLCISPLLASMIIELFVNMRFESNETVNSPSAVRGLYLLCTQRKRAK